MCDKELGFASFTYVIGSTSTIMQGIFDMSHTLGYWIKQYWMNLAVLIVSPMILLIISFVAFLRQDITL